MFIDLHIALYSLTIFKHVIDLCKIKFTIYTANIIANQS